MSYGTCKKAYKKITCLKCGNTAELSQLQQLTHLVFQGKRKRYLCIECFLKNIREE